jgi:hypothetical protein
MDILTTMYRLYFGSCMRYIFQAIHFLLCRGAITFGQSKIDTMLSQAKEILQWYDNMQKPVPNWNVGIEKRAHWRMRHITLMPIILTHNGL